MSELSLRLKPVSVLGTPSKICGLPNRDICVVDPLKRCLWVLDRMGKVKYKIGTGEKGHKDAHFRDAEFNAPLSAAVFHNSIFVIDRGNNLIREVNLANASVTTVKNSPPSPIDIYEYQDKLYILSSTDSSLYSLDPIRNQITKEFTGDFKSASGMTTNGEMLYFCDTSSGSIMAWNGSKMTTLFAASSPSVLNKPMSLSYSGNNLYIADTYNHQVKILSLITGALTPLIGTAKPGNKCKDFASSELNHPTSVFISGMSLFICDRGNNEIKVAELLMSTVQPFNVHL